MIFNFRIVSDEVENFRREIKIDADSTFLDLRNAIYDSVGYDKIRCVLSFYVTAIGKNCVKSHLKIWTLMLRKTHI